MVEVELALAPAYPWVEMVAAFDEFAVAARFAQALGEADGIFLKLDSLFAWPLAALFPQSRRRPARRASTSS